jgi:integrase
MHDDWIAKNPARAVKAPPTTDKPTLPFSRKEMKRILDACDQYAGNRDRMRAFVLAMRYSGLRIGDTLALECAPPRCRDVGQLASVGRLNERQTLIRWDSGSLRAFWAPDPEQALQE